jgi:spermidine synthase
MLGAVRRALLLPLFAALFVSGISGLVNQVAWQRALKLYVAGSETISSLIAVLVFMVGLGLGSLHVGLRGRNVRNPALLLALAELGLCAVNLLIAWLLSLDLVDSVYAFQRLAVAAGIPLRLLYSVTAVAVLLVPCYLMGLTMPLAADACQRQLGARRSSLVDVLFGVNTLGAVTGSLVTGLWLLPWFGQQTALFLAAAANGTAAAIVALALARLPAADPMRTEDVAPAPRQPLRLEEWMGFALGFLSLGYEMLLYRQVPLAHEPLPYTFAVVLTGFLLFWSLGVLLAARMRERIPLLLLVAAGTVAAMPFFHRLDRFTLGWGLVPAVAVYSLPCIPFGLLFGQVIARHARSWGRDVGRYYAMNTFGSFAGILAMTLLGFEIHYDAAAWLLALGFALMGAWFLGRDPRAAGRPRPAAAAAAVLSLAWVALAAAAGFDRPHRSSDRVTYSGRDGVVEIVDGSRVILDGLWHSHLSDGTNHLYTNNWRLAAIPVLCHTRDDVREACVIGLGTGLSVATLAEVESIRRIDAYEINHTLARVYRDYPDGTLRTAENPKVNILWQDGRSGIALADRRYDVIVQQPLWLKQAGSSILLSRSYLELLRSRLEPDGVLCLYSNSLGVHEQALLVRKTAAAVFPYRESFDGGYLLVLSMQPFSWSPETLLRKLALPGPFYAACRAIHPDALARIKDTPQLEWEACPFLVTDDHPLVEYPDVARRLITLPSSRQ